MTEGAKLCLDKQMSATHIVSAETNSTIVSWLTPSSQAAWYAAYTCANHERKVAEEISRRGLECFLPAFRTQQRWSDRYVELDRPLFPSYVFVRIALSEKLRILQVPGVVRLVGFSGAPAPLDDKDIAAVRAFLDRGLRAEPYPFLAAGRRVRVKAGPLQGLEGLVVRKRKGMRLVISLDLIQRSIAVEMEAADLERI